MTYLSEYGKFEAQGRKQRRMLREEELLFEVAETTTEAMEEEGLSRAELAERLEKSRSFVSQVLAGDRNITLRTLADLGDAMGCRILVNFVHRKAVGERVKIGPWGKSEFSVVSESHSTPQGRRSYYGGVG